VFEAAGNCSDDTSGHSGRSEDEAKIMRYSTHPF